MKSQPPVKEGQVISLSVTGLSHDGNGVGKYEDFAVFVPFAVPGEFVRVRITQVKKTWARGKLLEVLEPHPDRTEPKCAVFEACGGCQSQHLTYEAQLRHKWKQVKDCFGRIAGMDDVVIHPVIGMEDPWRYRNKSQVPFGVSGGRVVAGFYRPGTHEIVDMESCLIQHATNDRVVRAVKELVRELRIPVYNEQTHRGVLRHVMARSATTGQLMVVLVTNGPELPKKRRLVDGLVKRLPDLTSLVQNINERRTNVILGPENRVLWGEDCIIDRIGHVEFTISPHSFFQVNPMQTRVLYDQVVKLAALTGEETVIDAYCGTGTIALYLANRAKRVLGVEIVPEAIRDARRNAERNGIRHVRFETGAAEDVMPRWLEEGIRPDVIVVDPPRKGCDPKLLETAVNMRPKRIIYVSCNPATLARDAKRLLELGYPTVEVQPVDMFPQTGHVECVAWMRRPD
ncbi:23S rRNA (uracil(1939)-C(5))-methyltransferase RlmD [Staphylospora marina]|uniref:23S rRNA (uracil(1939)-C(5))-methyltransferase RlmD n=1 Tax=Staphylospora marina TaxID=2490858 RepID=UPI000F5BFB30|nr:23S rRNA (uracil(1939)-C(5))-methyltransferase RlmD [Staphylospora marina]